MIGAPTTVLLARTGSSLALDPEKITLDTLAQMWLRAPVLAAGILSLALSARRPGLRPLGAALLASLAADAIRAVARPPYEVAVALYLAPVALGAWVVIRALAPGVERPALAVGAGLSAVLLLVPPSARPVLGLFAATVVEVLVTACGAREIRGSLPARCALALVAGDVLGLLGPAGPAPWPASWAASGWAAAAQASVASAGVIAILWRDVRLRE